MKFKTAKALMCRRFYQACLFSVFLSIVPLRAAARQLWSATTAEILLVVRRVDREGDLAQCGGVLHRLAAIFIRIQIVIIA